MAEREGVLNRLRRPEYTGDNRCTPCTVLNVAMALSGSLLVVTWGTVYVGAETALAAGSVVFGVALALIFLRGYLVPGTPTLTTRYLPDRVLRWFDKPSEDAVGVHSGRGGDADAVDIERRLLDAGALEPCRDGDYCLTTDFEREWRAETDRFEAAENWAAALARFDVVDPEATVETDDGGSSFILRRDGHRLGSWESRVTARADAAASRLLAERLDDWEALSTDQRAQLAAQGRRQAYRPPRTKSKIRVPRSARPSCGTSAIRRARSRAARSASGRPSR